MKPNIDLTENRDFRGSGPSYHPSISTRFLFPRWTNKTSLFRPDSILKSMGVRTFSDHSDFPPRDRCECCGRLIAPWRDGLCKGCDSAIILTTPNEKIKRGLPRNPEMISDPRILWI